MELGWEVFEDLFEYLEQNPYKIFTLSSLHSNEYVFFVFEIEE